MANKTINFPQFISELDELVRMGKLKEFASHLSETKLSSVPSEHSVSLGQICLRANQPLLTLRILNPAIQRSRKFNISPSIKEDFLYSTCLTRLGFLDEAYERLQKLDPNIEPEVFFQTAALHFNRWSYAKAIPLLKKFIHCEKISDYRSFVGKINLLAALVAEGRYEESSEFSDQLLAQLLKTENYLLTGNCFELKSQIFFFKGQYQQALESLKEARTRLESFGGTYLAYVEKWVCLSQLMIDTKNQKTHNMIRDLFSRSKAAGYWEICRDLDLYLALALKDQNKLQQVFFGSPYESYRKHIKALLKTKISIPHNIERRLGNSESVLDTLNYDMFRSPILTKTLWLLNRDFYKPVNLGGLFNGLFPDQYFNPESSKARVHNHIGRLRSILAGQKSDFRIAHRREQFRIEGTGTILCHRSLLSRDEYLVQKFHKILGPKSFSCQELAKAIGLSPSKSLGVIKDLMGSGKVKKLGTGSNSRYQFSNRNL